MCLRLHLRLCASVSASLVYVIPLSVLQIYDTVYDKECPQKAPVDIIRCNAHQHFGGQCVELINLDKNETICRSCPAFGTEPGVPGDESGYVVKIPDDDLTPPYTIAPGTNVRIKVGGTLHGCEAWIHGSWTSAL